MINIRWLLVAALPMALVAGADGAVFSFGSNAGNGLHGEASGQLAQGGFTLSLETTLPDALLAELSQSGLGVNSRSNPAVGFADGSTDKMDVFGSSSSLAGQGEQIRFSFDKPGILKSINFDGVKDEDYEYFLLQSANNPDLYFFDSFQGSLADPGLINVPGQVIFLLEDPQLGGSSPIDDKTPPLSIRFEAGQEFLLTYGELAVGGGGNGGRLQAITVAEIPEPGSAILALGFAALAAMTRLRAQ